MSAFSGREFDSRRLHKINRKSLIINYLRFFIFLNGQLQGQIFRNLKSTIILVIRR